MCSGPDFFPDRRWRRIYSDSPLVTPEAYLKNFGRLAQAQCRSDWSALPIIRNVAFRWKAEHTMSQVTSILGQRGKATDTEVSDLVSAARSLYEKLHSGFVGSGVHRIPVAGDTTKLPYAAGLSPLEKRLAWAQHFLAKQLAGTQQLRQLMGHSQFGARVVYGDCLFVTISPNEQHSALVLRISRYRQKDPYIKHGKPERIKMARRDYPSLEQPTQPGDDSVQIDLPEYDLRRALTAQDPLAVIEAYKIEILLRLGTLLGIRICPNCPRCNDGPYGCQDKFGSNMRLGGGVLGGIPALGGGAEHQGYGTPHLHVEVHVACVYQHDTLADIVRKLQEKHFSM